MRAAMETRDQMISLRIPAAAALILAAAPASAITIDAANLLNQFALVSLGDADASSVNHIEGRAYVGGNLNIGSGYANSDGAPDVTEGGVSGALIVGGDATGTYQGGVGTVVVGGVLTAGSNNNIGARLVTGIGTDPDAPTANGAAAGFTGGVPVADVAAAFEQLSADLAAMSDTAGASISGVNGNWTISSGAGDANGLAVLNLDAATAGLMMNGLDDLTFNISTDVTLVVNVLGATYDSASLRVNNDTPAALLNFYEATSLTWGSVPYNSSVLAPYAAISTPGGGTRGSWVGASVDMGGEVRSFNGGVEVFTGDLSSVSSEVPVPAAAWLLLGGLGALAAAARRRRAA